MMSGEYISGIRLVKPQYYWIKDKKFVRGYPVPIGEKLTVKGEFFTQVTEEMADELVDDIHFEAISIEVVETVPEQNPAPRTQRVRRAPPVVRVGKSARGDDNGETGVQV